MSGLPDDDVPGDANGQLSFVAFCQSGVELSLQFGMSMAILGFGSIQSCERVIMNKLRRLRGDGHGVDG